MKLLIMSSLLSIAAMSVPAIAAGANDGHTHDEMAIGKPGDANHVDRSVEIAMKETDDGKMLFDPTELVARKGETIRIVVTNTGEVDHEFVMDGVAENARHRELMKRFPEMEHDDPNAVRLRPGETGEIIWTFSKAGDFEFACLIPGHYESGMHGPLKVAAE